MVIGLVGGSLGILIVASVVYGVAMFVVAFASAIFGVVAILHVKSVR